MILRKRETAEVRQQQITEVALHVIGQKGISGATTAEIAAASGISEGNLYRHFRSKEEIIEAIIDKIGADLSSSRPNDGISIIRENKAGIGISASIDLNQRNSFTNAIC